MPTTKFSRRGLAGLLTCLFFALGLGRAAKVTDEFAVADIPVDLTADADAVVRLEETSFHVENRKKATRRVRRVITVFNADGRDFGRETVWYDKFRKVKQLKGLIRNSAGKVVRELKKSEILDYPAISGYSLFDDNRVKIAKLYYSEYPYTVEFFYEVQINGFMNWSTWYPQSHDIAVEKSLFEVRTPAGMMVRYKTRGTDLQPTITSNKNGFQTYRWEASLLPKPESEPFSPSWSERMPSVMVASNEFEIDGFVGDMSTWLAFGKFYYDLNQDRGILPAGAREQVDRLVANVTDVREKARRIYEHLQSTTRYVSIQLGIGGWRTFDASYVFERKYGDCKALTNYLLAMLKHAGVDAHPALVMAGGRKPDLVTDFSCNQFNHVILCVPTPSDTLWLECTSQTIPFGHLGTFTEDRTVLLVNSDGGKLVRTPKSTARDNQQLRKANVILLEDGNAAVSARTTYTGNQQDRVRRRLAQSSDLDRKKWLRESLDVPSFEIRRADFSDINDNQLSVTIPVELSLRKYGSRSNTRLFLKPNLFERWKRVPAVVENRTQPVHLAYAYLDVDTVSYKLPQGFTIEAAPDSVQIETSFGSYVATVTSGTGTLQYVRRMELRENKLLPGAYAEYREFLQQVVKADNAQVVLVKKP